MSDEPRSPEPKPQPASSVIELASRSSLPPAPVKPASAQPQLSRADASIPKEQVRSFAFLYAPGQQDACAAFGVFLRNVALKVSKKPLSVRTVLALEVQPGAGAPAILEAVKSSGAVGSILWLSGMPEVQAQEIEHASYKEEIFLRSVAPEKAQKRAFAMDMLFEIMLLKAG
jgi:hypothetical protein